MIVPLSFITILLAPKDLAAKNHFESGKVTLARHLLQRY